MTKFLPLLINEINFNIFKDISVEYHNELYGHLEATELLADFESTQPKKPYKRYDKNNKIKNEEPPFSRFIRHQIHHPENKLNKSFNEAELEQSIKEMRKFIIAQKTQNN